MRISEIIAAIWEAGKRNEINEWLDIEELSDTKSFDELGGKQAKTPKTKSIDQLASKAMKTPELKSVSQMAKETQSAGLRKSKSCKG